MNTLENQQDPHLHYYDKLAELIYWKDALPYWAVNRASCARMGDLAGCVSHQGYRILTITVNKKCKKIKASRLHWYMVYGVVPEKDIDHINRIKTDDRIENLRLIDHRHNMRNANKWSSKTSSKYKGVHRDNRSNRWIAQIKVNGKSKHLISSLSEIEAAKAYDQALIDNDLAEYSVFNFPQEVKL